MKYEYDILDISLPQDLLQQLTEQTELGSPPQHDLRVKVSTFIKTELNKVAQEGWKLHESGLSGLPMVVVYREKAKGKKKNVR